MNTQAIDLLDARTRKDRTEAFMRSGAYVHKTLLEPKNRSDIYWHHDAVRSIISTPGVRGHYWTYELAGTPWSLRHKYDDDRLDCLIVRGATSGKFGKSRLLRRCPLRLVLDFGLVLARIVPFPNAVGFRLIEA